MPFTRLRSTWPLRLVAAAAGMMIALLAMSTPPARADDPDILKSFHPGQAIPGVWRGGPDDRTDNIDTGAGICTGGKSRSWKRQDGTEFTLNWWICPTTAAEELADEAFASRLRMGSAPGVESYLGGADAVFLVGDATVRSWVQKPYAIQLRTDCPAVDFAGCAPLSGPASRQIAQGLPGEPLNTSLMPSFTRVVSSVLTLWLLVIGLSTFFRRIVRPRFDEGVADPRMTSVEPSARSLRFRQWGRRTAFVLGFLSTLALAGAVLNPQDRPLVYVLRLALFLVLLALAIWVFRACQHPMLGPTLPPSRRFRMARPSLRRVLGAVTVFVLAVALSTAPFAAVLVLMVLGFIAQSGQSGMTDDDVRMLFAAVLIIAVALGFLLDRAGRRLRMRNAWEAISADPRPPILYLRNFGDDKQKVPTSALGRTGPWQVLTGWLNPVRTNRFEEILTRALARFGPVIAVDPPGTRFSGLGAAKTALPHDNWLQQVTQWAQGAHAVVVSAAPQDLRPGLRDELRMLAESVPHGRVVLILGPHKNRASLHAAIGRFLGAVYQYTMFRNLAERPVADGSLVLVHMPAHGWGHWRGWSSRSRTAWTYTAAVYAAMTAAGEVWIASSRDQRDSEPGKIGGRIGEQVSERLRPDDLMDMTKRPAE